MMSLSRCCLSELMIVNNSPCSSHQIFGHNSLKHKLMFNLKLDILRIFKNIRPSSVCSYKNRRWPYNPSYAPWQRRRTPSPSQRTFLSSETTLRAPAWWTRQRLSRKSRNLRPKPCRLTPHSRTEHRSRGTFAFLPTISTQSQ